MKPIITACMAMLSATVALSDGAATNTVALTDAEVRMVERARVRNAKVAARNRAESIARKATGMTRSAPDGATFAASVRRMVPKTVYGRRRIVGMDAESSPGFCIYTYAQGARVWCETNALKAIEFKATRNRYSKLKIVVAAKAAGKWDALKAGIAEANLEDEWNACQYIEDGDPSFVAATNAVVAAGISTAEEIAAFLVKAIDN